MRRRRPLRYKTRRDIANVAGGTAILTFAVSMGASMAAHLPTAIAFSVITFALAVVSLVANPH